MEGREKMKIVVQKTYTGSKELYSMFNVDKEALPESTLTLEDAEGGGERDTIFDMDGDLEGDITMLAKEELTMMLPERDEDDIDTDTKVDSGYQTQRTGATVPGAGASEEDAILLSDDEDEKPPETTSASAASQSVTPPSSGQAAEEKSGHPASPQFQNCRYYNLLFDGPSFGMQLRLHRGRPIASRKIDTSQEKPAVGDILVAANGLTLPPIQNISQITNHLKTAKLRGPVELTFAELDAFSTYFKLMQEAETARLFEELRASQILIRPPPQGSGEVIELLDDD